MYTLFSEYPFIFKDSGEVYPFVEVLYKADDWLFIDEYSISADGYRWDSSKRTFDRDNSGGTIWEWDTDSLNDEYIKVLSKMANAKSSKIRFRGRQYYADYELTSSQKSELASLIELANLTK